MLTQVQTAPGKVPTLILGPDLSTSAFHRQSRVSREMAARADKIFSAERPLFADGLWQEEISVRDFIYTL